MSDPVPYAATDLAPDEHAQTERQQELVREAAGHMVRFKLAKFKGIYNAYN